MLARGLKQLDKWIYVGKRGQRRGEREGRKEEWRGEEEGGGESKKRLNRSKISSFSSTLGLELVCRCRRIPFSRDVHTVIVPTL